MIAGGARSKPVSQCLVLVQERIELPIALVMPAVGASLIVFFGGVVGFRAL